MNFTESVFNISQNLILFYPRDPLKSLQVVSKNHSIKEFQCRWSIEYIWQAGYLNDTRSPYFRQVSVNLLKLVMLFIWKIKCEGPFNKYVTVEVEGGGACDPWQAVTKIFGGRGIRTYPLRNGKYKISTIISYKMQCMCNIFL